MLPALREDYFRVDEMRFEQLLSLSSGFARLLDYYNSDLQPDGDWSALFESDDAALLSTLLATRLKPVEAEMNGILERWHEIEAELRDGRTAMESLPTLALALRIDDWYRQFTLLSSVAAARARDRIADLVDEMLAVELRALRAWLRRLDETRAASVFGRFGTVWRLDDAGGEPHPVNEGEGRHFLKANFYAFRNAIVLLQEAAAAMLQESLGRSNREPAMGLFIAFLQLFARVQQRINGFTARHLDFYYGDVLKIARRDFVPDSAYLILRPDVAGREVRIARGTEFRAGVDENNVDLVYAADGDLLLTDARVAALHTLYLERDPLVSPENRLEDLASGGLRQYVTGARLNHVEVAERPPASGEALAQPLFGSTRRGNRRLFENARLGFAVASNVLLLREGRRDVVLTIRFAGNGGLEKFVHELSERLGISQADAFFKAFRQMFRISLTAETGWLEVGEYLPLCRLVDDGCEPDSLVLRFQLPDSAAAVVGHASAIHGERYDTTLPVLKAEINPESYFFGYSLLRAMRVREVAIEVGVEGCTDLQVYNQLGKLSANAQFSPFGPLPAVGDHLVIGCYEAACKKLTAFEVNLEWGGLPLGPQGFEGHYQSYPMQFDSDTFRVNLAVLRDRRWQPGSGERPETPLFLNSSEAKESGSREVGAKRRLVFDGLCELARPLEQVPAAEFGYDALTKDGFFRVTLAGPHYAFGHRDFPMVMSQVMTENARLNRFSVLKLLRKLWPTRVPRPQVFVPKSRTLRVLMPYLLPGGARAAMKPAAPAKLPPHAAQSPSAQPAAKPMPSPPYTPQINAISVNYRAAATISLGNVTSAEQGKLAEKLYHLHPLGLEALSPKVHGRIHLVPQYDGDGNLLIGIAASKPPGMLSLYFHLRDDSLAEAGDADFGFSWYYLSGNRWKRFKDAQVISDGTRGFLCSGIVALEIPADMDRDNTILPGDLYWLRVSSSSGKLHALCSLYSVYAQALRVSWRRQEGNSPAHLAQALPAGTIAEPRRTIPGLASILQIDASSGGASAETREQWLVRTSERLHHKNRAVTPWDYERLILQQFPGLYKVKCFPCMSDNPEHRGKPMPGHLLIAVIPYPGQGMAGNMQPMANALLLREVREYVAGLASAFAHIEVRNPSYEKVQVRCRVRLKPGVAQGLSLKRLNQAIVDYLSPWGEGGYKARFDWRLRCNDVQSMLRGLDYVEAVAAVSLLHISEAGDGRHRLFDTARRDVAEIRPAYPWSIAVPAGQHLVGAMDAMGAWPPEPTGIAELSIGDTFILSGNHHA